MTTLLFLPVTGRRTLPGGFWWRLDRLRMVASVLPFSPAGGPLWVMDGCRLSPEGVFAFPKTLVPDRQTLIGAPGETLLLAEMHSGVPELRLVVDQGGRTQVCLAAEVVEDPESIPDIISPALRCDVKGTPLHWWLPGQRAGEVPEDLSDLRPLLGEDGPVTLQEWSDLFGSGLARRGRLLLLRLPLPGLSFSFLGLFLVSVLLLWPGVLLMLTVLGGWTALDLRARRWQRERQRTGPVTRS